MLKRCLDFENAGVKDTSIDMGVTVSHKRKYAAAAETRNDSNKVRLTISNLIDNPIYFFMSLRFVTRKFCPSKIKEYYQKF